MAAVAWYISTFHVFVVCCVQRSSPTFRSDWSNLCIMCACFRFFNFDLRRLFSSMLLILQVYTIEYVVCFLFFKFEFRDLSFLTDKKKTNETQRPWAISTPRKLSSNSMNLIHENKIIKKWRELRLNCRPRIKKTATSSNKFAMERL